jgi:alkanesulfonate monooxygenase SsuD/methylene tetrahydromethanopterin reductase-like flavin-dependent oxidoreductase (luciferase family)
MAGVPLIAADTDEEAQRFATSPALRFLKLLRGEPIFTPPPVASMDGLWSEVEKHIVQSKLKIAVVGGPEAVRLQLNAFLTATGADELIFTSDVYDHEARLRSFEIGANVMRSLPVHSTELQEA